MVKTTDAISDRVKPSINIEAPTQKEKNYGWHFVRPFALAEAGIKRPKAKCACGRMASVLSASHHVPQELWFACRHCCHTFYRTNEGPRV